MQRRLVRELRRTWPALLRSQPRQWDLHGPRYQMQRGNLRQVRGFGICMLFRCDGQRRNLQRRWHHLQQKRLCHLRYAGQRLLSRQWVRQPRLLLQQLSGAIPAVTSSTDYTTHWGIELAIPPTPTTGGNLGQSFSSLTVSMTGSPQSGLRVVTHRKTDSGSTIYCATMVPGVSIPFTNFNTACWDGSGTRLAAADVANLDMLGIQIPSASSAITITNLCLLGITFAK